MKLLVQYSPSNSPQSISQSTYWDTRYLLRLGHPTQLVLEKKDNIVYIHDFRSTHAAPQSLVKIPLTGDHFNCPLSVSSIAQDPAKIILFTKRNSPKIDWDKVNTLPTISLPDVSQKRPEDLLYKKLSQRIGAAALLCFLLVLLWPKGKEAKKEEELIPEKYAKLIMTKPKATPKVAGGATAQSSAPTKAVARAFQSKTVKQSMQAILKGGLSKYSVMATGKSIQSLTSSLQNQMNQTGTALQGKASDLLGAQQVGAYKLGSETGYGAGGGLGVKGQGTGMSQIGLNYGDATVDEGLTKEEVAKVIHAHMSEIRFCYESAIISDPTIAGKVMIDFKINAQGKVATASRGESSLNSTAVPSCLVSKLKNWQFPQPRGGVTVSVSYPFIFKALSR